MGKLARSNYGLSLFLSGIVCAALGCGDSDMGSVRGVVTLDGQPLEGAQVTFKPVANGVRSSVGISESDGSYKLEYSLSKSGARVGKHTVKITTYCDMRVDRETGLFMKGTPEQVPMKYNTQTTLEAEVASGRNTMDWELDSQGEIAKHMNQGDGEGDL